jgi:hypothetical protein
LLGDADFAWADGLRRLHFPPERNQLRAHLTMFHHLAPALESELCARLKILTKSPAPKARITGILDLGGGVAYRVDSPDLEACRDSLADAFETYLTPQDRARWRPHITVQNKVTAEAAKKLRVSLAVDFVDRPLDVAGLAVFRYLGGPWEAVGAWRFGQGHAMQPPTALRS